MLQRLLVLLGLLSGTFGYAKTVSSVAISPQGAVLVVGTSMQYSVLCTYSDSSTDDCTAAGGATWSTPTAALALTNSGQVTWNSSYDPQNKSLFPEGAQTAIGIVSVTAGGVSDTGQLLAQGSGATFIVWTTPDPGFYGDIQTGAYPTPTVAVGATVTIGAGFQWNQGGPANPFQMTCNWSSSDNTIATVNRYGMATAVAPGTVTITCGAAGNGQYETDVQYSGNTFTFNVVALTPTKQTWYVRPNGGTPFINSTQTPNGQCDGLHDADYPGTGVDQPCAVGNFRYLWTDQVTPNHEQWMIGPGDTVIIRQNPNGYNLGLDALSPAYGGTTGTQPINCGNPDCYMPTIPSGTASNHTRILGENYGSCTSDSAKTKLLVSWGAIYGINVRDSQFVDVSCLEVTQVAACAYGSAWTNACPGNSNYGRNGVVESALTSNVTYTDLFVHGLALEAIRGATGGGVVLNRVHIRGTPFGGLDMDDIPHSISNISVAGGITMNNSLTEFVGCIEEKPQVHNYPYIECRDQQTGGYGDGFGTGSTTGNWNFDHDVWRYNFQDGLDLLHSGLQSLSVTNSQSYGNDGNQFKLGSAQNVNFQNNFAVSNCQRILYTFGDEPASAIVPGVDPCRADGGDVIISFYAYGNYTVQNNTMVGYGDVILGYHCDFGSDNCSTANTILQNNTLMGYADSNNGYNGGENAAMICAATASDCDNALSDFPANQGWAVRNNNQYDGTRKCPISLTANESCNTQDPLFVGEPANPITDETVFDNFTGHLTSSSTLIGAGVAIPSLLVDITGALRPNPPSIGAFEYASSSALATSQVTLAATPNPATVGQSVTVTATVAEVGSTMPTGSVTFSNNGTSLGSATLNSSGVATLSSSSLPAGSDSITVTYTGDSTYAAGASNPYALTVNSAAKTSTAATIASSLNPATTGQAVTLTATVSASSGSSTPTGTVTFLDGSTSLGSATLTSSGTATIQLNSITAGSHTLTSQYGGDSNFSASTSTALTETVNSSSAPATTTTLVPSVNPATTNQAVTLTATVTTNGGSPNGTVTFFDGSTSLGSATISSGAAAIQVTSFAAGNHTLTAQYAGNSNFAASTSSPVAETVNSPAAANTATSLAASPNPATAGQAVTLSATVATNSGTPTGTVTFFDGSTSLGSATISSGVAAIQVTSFAAGIHALSAQYAGNSSFNASASSAVSETVNAPAAAQTTTLLQTSASQVVAGQTITLTATVSSTSGKPTGSVTFLAGNTTLGTATLSSSGSASIQVSSLAVGNYSLTAQYAGNSSFAASVSSTISETVSATTIPTTTATLAISPNPTPTGQSATMTVTVTSTSGTPTGTVSFLNNGTTIGSATLNSSGVATYTPSSLPAAGTYPITVQYAGNSSFGPSTSNAVQWQVETSGVTLSLNSSNLSVPNGVSSSNTVTLTLTPFGGYSGTLQAGCQNPPAGTTCSFSPQSVNVNGGPANVTVTVKTSPVASLEPRNLRPFEAGKELVFSASFLWIPGILTAAFVGFRRRQLMPRSGRVLLLLVLGCMFGALTGCGSGATDPLTTTSTMPLQLVVSGPGIANQSITLTITTTNH
jgi:hypothetical protein